jgi:hypothetical protein
LERYDRSTWLRFGRQKIFALQMPEIDEARRDGDQTNGANNRR